MITYGSVCSGIEAASVAFRDYGWQAAWFSEIERFPSSVLSHHYPEIVNYGDMRQISELILSESIQAPDILCGGTPCQAFSLNGSRKSLNDDRGNLSLEFCRIADAIDYIRAKRGEHASIIFWENVPGVLSTHDNAFGCFISQLGGSEYEIKPSNRRWPSAGIYVGEKRTVAWRVLDAQYFGLPQRRKRVFVVASARYDLDIGEVLFECDHDRENAFADRERSGEVTGNNEDSNARFHQTTRSIAFKVRTKGHCTGEKGGAIINTKVSGGHGMIIAHEKTFTLSTSQHQYITYTTEESGAYKHFRKLTPRECERLQGFPDDYTLIEYNGSMAPDSLRYRAIGNSWPINVIRWIAGRINTIMLGEMRNKE